MNFYVTIVCFIIHGHFIEYFNEDVLNFNWFPDCLKQISDI